MNSASKDFDHHLGQLRQRLEHPSDYERAITYFLEEFAGDAGFIRQSDPDASPAVEAILGKVIEQMLSRRVSLERPAAFRLRDHPFLHGNAVVGRHAVVYLLFPEAGLGVAALIPGVSGAMEVARFKLPGRLPKPELN